MTAYRKSSPYRKPQTYRGDEAVPGAAVPNHRSHHGLGWDRSIAASAQATARWRRTQPHAAGDALRFDGEQPHGDVTQCPSGQADPHNDAALLPFGAMGVDATTTTAPFGTVAAHDRPASAGWADCAEQHSDVSGASWGAMAAHNRMTALPWGQLATHALSRSLLWRMIVARGGFVALPWGPIGARSAATIIEWPVQPDPGTDPLTVPILPVYVMLPTLAAVRLPDRTPLNLLAITLQHDQGSWAWTFSAPMNARDVPLLGNDGDPTQIEVTVNGHVWTFIVDGYDANRRFGSRTVTLRGRSRNALLAGPHAAVRTFTQGSDRLAQQLAGDELLGSGWTLVWDTVDWLVPGGTFSYQDLAPIDAIAQVASAVGATIAPDRAALSMTVAPVYPLSPWTWDASTPYAILPASILTLGDSSWQGGINADGVYVYAENAASGALVKLTGTAGANQVPMVVERLLVTSPAQGERGRNELARAGKVRRVNRTLPLFPSPPPAGFDDLGVIPVGKLLEVNDPDETWRGQVVGVRIEATRAGAAISVRQHLTIERQYR